MVAYTRGVASSCLAALLILPAVAGASVVKGEHGETFVDPIFVEEATAKSEFSLKIDMDRFATSYYEAKLYLVKGVPTTYVDSAGVKRFDWYESQVKRAMEIRLEAAAEYAFSENFSLEIRAPFIMSGDRPFLGSPSEQPAVISRYDNVAQKPPQLKGDKATILAIQQNEYTTGLQSEPIWLTGKYTIYAARGPEYSNALSVGFGAGFLTWGQMEPRHYYAKYTDNITDANGQKVELKWYDFKDTSVLLLRPFLAFQRSYGTWQVGGQVGAQVNIMLKDSDLTYVDVFMGLTGSYLLTDYLAGVLEFVGSMNLYGEPALWGFAPGLRLILPFGDESTGLRLNAGLGVLLPFYDDGQTDPYNPAVRLTMGLEF
ncbi:MAG: hypothetical protein GXP49_16905 [Deltaproteobacteria bacterium]|nr:hypothetical protein [Deltaproteobacteria bacterium]